MDALRAQLEQDVALVHHEQPSGAVLAPVGAIGRVDDDLHAVVLSERVGVDGVRGCEMQRAGDACVLGANRVLPIIVTGEGCDLAPDVDLGEGDQRADAVLLVGGERAQNCERSHDTHSASTINERVRAVVAFGAANR